MRSAVVALLFSAAGSAACAACTRGAPPPVAPIDVAVADVPDAGPSAPPAAHPPMREASCTATLVASPIQVRASCYLDEQISKEPGTLSYPCEGDGPVEATFGEHRFTGTLTEGTLALELVTELDWEDNCRWQTRQAIKGDLGTKRLLWTYADKPIVGTGCSGSCKATAAITIEPSR